MTVPDESRLDHCPGCAHRKGTGCGCACCALPPGMTPQIAAVAAVMDEIDQCRAPVPCDQCRQRMQSILDMGAAAERERLLRQLGHDGETARQVHELLDEDDAADVLTIFADLLKATGGTA